MLVARLTVLGERGGRIYAAAGDSFQEFFSGLIWAFKVKGKMPRSYMKLMNLCLVKLEKFQAKMLKFEQM